jgi:hypothetical protein
VELGAATSGATGWGDTVGELVAGAENVAGLLAATSSVSVPPPLAALIAISTAVVPITQGRFQNGLAAFSVVVSCCLSLIRPSSRIPPPWAFAET